MLEPITHASNCSLNILATVIDRRYNCKLLELGECSLNRGEVGQVLRRGGLLGVDDGALFIDDERGTRGQRRRCPRCP